MSKLRPRKNGKIMSKISDNKAEEFLSIASQFRLGGLVTESVNPATKNLSSLARENLHEAITILKELDLQTILVLAKKKKQIHYLKDAILGTLNSGNNIFFCKNI